MHIKQKSSKAVYLATELPRSWLAHPRGLNVVMSRMPDWERALLQYTRFTPHRFTFADLTTVDLGKFDLAMPLTLEDVLYFADRPGLAAAQPIAHPSRPAVELLHDKLAFDRFVRNLGYAQYLPAASSGSVDGPSLPCIVKPREGIFGRNCHLIRTEAERHANRQLFADESFIVQSYIPGDREYAVHLYVEGGLIVRHLGIEYLFNTPYPIKGVDGPSILGIFRCPFLTLWLSILNAARFQGFCCVNYKVRPDGTPVILEINPRMGGSLSFVFFSFLRNFRPTTRRCSLPVHEPAPDTNDVVPAHQQLA